MSSSEKLKLQNMKSIFELCLPQLHGQQAPPQKSAVIDEEEKQGDDVMMIDSSSHRNHKG